MYKVLVMFTDLQDNGYKYLPGNEYPRKGLNPSPERIRELATTANKRGIKLIDGKIPEKVEKPVEEVKESEEPIEESEEPTEDFMNLPEEPVEEPIEEAPKKRGRKKNAD